MFSSACRSQCGRGEKAIGSPGFDNLTLDQALDVLQRELGTLSRLHLATFFAIAGEALLPLYIRFMSKTGWGDPEVLKRAIAAVLQAATSMPNFKMETKDLISAVADVTPGDEFDGPDSTFAQDTAVCVDAALKAVAETEPVNPKWVWYALEPTIQTVCLEQTGYLDLGTSSQAKEWNSVALRHPVLRQAFEAVSEIIDYLTRRGETVSQAELEALRRLSAPLAPLQKC